MLRTSKTTIKIFLIIVVAFSACVFESPKPVKAANASSFNPAIIISDGVFTNKNSMSPSDIQAFLNAKVPVCDTWHAGSGNNQPPFTCLKEYQEGGLSAAQIIYNKAQEFNINPQVMLVLLQKEQGLVTDTWPWAVQYRSATGYGCPDGAACDSEYYGFTNQVHHANRMFRKIMDNDPNWYTPYRPGVNFIRYNPNAGCGGTNVNIQNRATAALYNYTPYQPNSAALNNLYGTGDGCSAYGNRNFWRDFTDWFGNPLGQPYMWELVSQRGYTYDGSALRDPAAGVVAGEKMIFWLEVRNTGTATWSNTGSNPIRLGTSHSNDRNSSHCDLSWLSCGRPVNLLESSVPPGGVGHFQFLVQAPSSPGIYKEYFTPLAEGYSWMNDIGLHYIVNVATGSANYSVVSDSFPADINEGATSSGSITVRNDSNFPWYQNSKYPIRMITSSPFDRTSAFRHSSWLGPTRPTSLQSEVIYPGQNATLNFSLHGGSDVGPHSESFSLVADAWQQFPASFTRNIKINTAYFGTLSSNATVSLTGADTSEITLTYKNDGTESWLNSGTNPVRIGTAGPDDRNSIFCYNWLSCGRPASLQQSSVAPGANGTFQFTLHGNPTKPSGTYVEKFVPLAEGIKRFPQTASVTVNYNPGTYAWALTDQYAYTDANKTTEADMNNLSRNQTILIGFKARNTGTATWYNNGAFPVRVGTSKPFDRISSFCHASWLGCWRPTAMTQSSVAPGQEATFEFLVTTPNATGNYNEYFTPMIEGYRWLNDIGLYYNFRVN